MRLWGQLWSGVRSLNVLVPGPTGQPLPEAGLLPPISPQWCPGGCSGVCSGAQGIRAPVQTTPFQLANVIIACGRAGWGSPILHSTRGHWPDKLLRARGVSSNRRLLRSCVLPEATPPGQPRLCQAQETMEQPPPQLSYFFFLPYSQN